MSEVKDLQALAVGDEGIAELHGDAGGRDEFGRGDLGGDLRMQRVGELDDFEAAVAEDICERSGDGDAARAVEFAFGVEGRGAFEEVVARISVEQRADAGLGVADDDEALVLVGDVEEGVERGDRLLLVFLDLYAQRVERQRGGRGDGGGELRLEVEALAERRDRRGDHALRDVLHVHVGDVEDAEAARAHGGVEVLAAQLHVLHVAAAVRIGGLEFPALLDEARVVAGIGEVLEIAAYYCGRLGTLSDGHGGEALAAVGDVDVLAHEVEEVAALYEQLRHPGVVVAVARDVAVGAAFGLSSANGVRDVGAEGLAAEARRGDGLLLLIEPVAVRVLRADDNCAGTSDRRDLVAGDGAVDAEHVDVVAQHHEVVVGVVARGLAFVVQHGGLLVGGHGEMAAEAGGGPR